jgi:hypothetical protein
MGASFGTYLTSLEALSRPPSICLARCKLGLLRRGQTDDGSVDVVPLLGGITLHVLHALLPLAPRCGSVGNVLALLLYSFRAGLGVASGSVFFFCWCSSNRVGHRASLVVLPCNVAP